MSSYLHRGSGSSAAKSDLRLRAFNVNRKKRVRVTGCCSQTTWRWGVRDQTQPPNDIVGPAGTGQTWSFTGSKTRLKCHRSVGEPAEGSLNLSTTTQRTNRTCPLVLVPHRGTGRRAGDTLRSAHGSDVCVSSRDPCPLPLLLWTGRECACRSTLLSNPTNPNTQRKLKRKCVCSNRAPNNTNKRQLSTTDILAPASMKNAAKCDT